MRFNSGGLSAAALATRPAGGSTTGAQATLSAFKALIGSVHV